MRKNIGSTVMKYYLVEFLGGFHFFSAVLVPFFTEWGGVNLATAQALQSWFTLCIFLLEVPTGVIADLIGRKYSVAMGFLAMATGALVYGWYPDLWRFVLGEFLFAIGIALISGADIALLYDSLNEAGKEKEATKIVGRSHSIHMLGIGIASLLGGMIAKEFGLNAPMLLTAIPVAGGAIVAFSIPEPARSNDPVELRSFTVILKKGMMPLRSNDTLKRWAINSTIVATAAYFVLWLYQPLMIKLAIPIEFFGIAHAGLVVAEIVIAMNFGRLVKVFGSIDRYLNFSAVSVFVSFVVAAVWPHPLSLVLFLFFAGGVGLTRMELMNAEMNHLIDSGERATVFSSISMIRRIAQAGTNPFVGLLTDQSVILSLLTVGFIPTLCIFAPLKRDDTDKK